MYKPDEDCKTSGNAAMLAVVCSSVLAQHVQGMCETAVSLLHL